MKFFLFFDEMKVILANKLTKKSRILAQKYYLADKLGMLRNARAMTFLWEND